MFLRHYSSCVLPVMFLAFVTFDLGVITAVPGVLFFVAVPILDPLIGKDRRNFEPEAISKRAGKWLAMGPVIFTVLYVMSIVTGIRYVAARGDALVLISSLFSVGTIGGVGFSAAHELVHKKGQLNKMWGRVGLLALGFMHFEIEHLSSHHRHACTERDTSTAWYGESVYSFLRRTIPAGFRFSWRFETRRLARIGQPAWSYRNRVIWYFVLPSVLCVLILITSGPYALILYLGQAFIGVNILLIAAYIEHYGLMRKSNGEGRSERLQAQHSWDSYYTFSNSLSFMVQRHSDHHLVATRTYPLLQSQERAIELPAGYQAMIALALAPPLWRRVIHPLLETAGQGRSDVGSQVY